MKNVKPDLLYTSIALALMLGATPAFAEQGTVSTEQAAADEGSDEDEEDEEEAEGGAGAAERSFGCPGEKPDGGD